MAEQWKESDVLIEHLQSGQTTEKVLDTGPFPYPKALYKQYLLGFLTEEEYNEGQTIFKRTQKAIDTLQKRLYLDTLEAYIKQAQPSVTSRDDYVKDITQRLRDLRLGNQLDSILRRDGDDAFEYAVDISDDFPKAALDKLWDGLRATAATKFMDGWVEMKQNDSGMSKAELDMRTASDIASLIGQGPGGEYRPRVTAFTEREYEIVREKMVEEMRNNPTYQFCMLLAGFTRENMSKYWKTESEGLNITTNTSAESDLRFHRWYVRTSWADGHVHLSPLVFAHIEEGYVMVTMRWGHLRGASLDLFIETAEIRTMFARLVAWNIRHSDTLAGKRYNLNSTFLRVNQEKARVLHWFKNVQYRNNRLTFTPINTTSSDLISGMLTTYQRAHLDAKAAMDARSGIGSMRNTINLLNRRF